MEAEEKRPKKDNYLKILTVEMISIGLILLTVVIFKYFFKSKYEDFKKWYSTYALTDTEISEVLGEKNEI